LTGESAVDAQPVVPPRQAAIAGTGHTLVLIVVLIAWAFWDVVRMDRLRAMEHPNRIALYVLTIIWQWSTVACVVFGVARRGGSLRDIVGGRWNRIRDFLRDWGIAVILWFAALATMILLSVALHLGHSNQGTRFLNPQRMSEIILWLFVSLTAGICEEIIFRGYLQRQFIAWTGRVPAGILLSAIIFGTMHLYQGGKSAIVLGVFGLLFGILAQRRRSLRPGMMAHAWHDVFIGLIGKLIQA
jgi:membrane protease YdiL (CAAX protease family)